jgi:hypothetical protein
MPSFSSRILKPGPIALAGSGVTASPASVAARTPVRFGLVYVDLRDQLGADTDPDFQSHIRMLPGEMPGRGGQRVDRDLLDGAEPHNAGETRRCQATATKAQRRPRSSIGIDRKLRLLKVPNIVSPLNVPSPFSGSFVAGVAPRLRPSGTPSAERLREGLPDS